jgi:hypothetical protein
MIDTSGLRCGIYIAKAQVALITFFSHFMVISLPYFTA